MLFLKAVLAATPRGFSENERKQWGRMYAFDIQKALGQQAWLGSQPTRRGSTAEAKLHFSKTGF